jgi:DNA repair protein RadC
MESPRDVWDLLHKRYATVGYEMFEVLLVSNQGELIGSPITVATGQADRVTVDIEQIVGPIIARVQDGAAGGGAKGFIVSHVHPSSGHYARPSAADKRLTEDIREAAKTGCPSTAFIDHVVVSPVNAAGDGEYYSFSESKSTKVGAPN